MIVTFFAMSRGGYTTKEKIFFALAWTPKATVQAALSGTEVGRCHVSLVTHMCLYEYGMAWIRTTCSISPEVHVNFPGYQLQSFQSPTFFLHLPQPRPWQ